MPNDSEKLRVLHTADLHLGTPFNWLGDQAALRQKDQLATLRKIVSVCIEQQVDLLLIAGDLFDLPCPDVPLCLSVQAEFARLDEQGIKSVLLPGTHDSIWGGGTVYVSQDFPGAFILDRRPKESPCRILVNGKTVYLYGSAYRGEAVEEFYPGMRRQEGDGYHVGLLHGSLKKGTQWNYREKDIPFSFDELNSWGLDYVALGHYHSFETLSHAGSVIACYPGSPEGKNFTECGERYIALVEISAENTRVEKLSVQTRRLESITVDMNLNPSPGNLKKQIVSLADEYLLLRVELSGQLDSPLDIHGFRNDCRELFFYLDVVDETHILDGTLVRQLAREETIAGACIRKFQQLLREDPEDAELIENAMKEVVTRFRSGGDL